MDESDSGSPTVYLNPDLGDWPSYSMINAHEVGHLPYTTGDLYMTPWQQKQIAKRNLATHFGSPAYGTFDEKGELINPIMDAPPSAESYAMDMENWAHDAEPMETRADLFLLRYQLAKEGIYDSSKDGRFTKKHWKKFLESQDKGKTDWNRLQRLYEDKDIIWLMNNIAENSSKKDLPVAQSGGDLEFFDTELDDAAIAYYRSLGYQIDELE
jgi:hypothetical protein